MRVGKGEGGTPVGADETSRGASPRIGLFERVDAPSIHATAMLPKNVKLITTIIALMLGATKATSRKRTSQGTDPQISLFPPHR